MTEKSDVRHDRSRRLDWGALVCDPDFQQVYASDPVLTMLEEEMRNPEAERRDLSYLLGASCAIELGAKVIPVPPPAPGHIALWYLADSPLLLRSRPWTDRDGLEALYILLKGNLAPVATSRPVDQQDVLSDAVDAFFVDAGPVDHAALRRDLEQMLRDAWHPYALMPHPEDAAEEG